MFSLSESGMDQFPGRYVRLTRRLLEQLKERMPEAEVGQLFAGVAEAMADTYASQLDGLPLPLRLERLRTLLNEEGFDADIGVEGDQVVIRELSCPYFRIGRQHREVCTIDQSFIAAALSLPVEKVTCLLDGDVSCTFTLPLGSVAEEVSSHDG